MSEPSLTYYLRVQQIEQSCLFELSWGEQGQRLSRTLKLPPNLITFYQTWQHAYLSFYHTLNPSLSPLTDESGMMLRARVVSQGTMQSTTTDWQGQLVEAEAKLLYEFHRWLKDAELFDIRAKLAEASHYVKSLGGDRPLELFLTCSPLDLDRLPWETWEIGSDLGAASKVRLVRTPDNLLEPPILQPIRRRKPRILAIVGTDPNLSFDTETQAIQRLERVADLQIVAWKTSQPITLFKTQIAEAIANPQGWDALLFIGHSEETSLTGGELGIAPHTSIRIQEIAAELKQAKANGLQFALFNSCKGLQIAESLVELGLSQVVIMREPIHHVVAQEFLIRFLDELANYKDVHESLIEACQFLELQKKLTYPSVHLVPSLFCHPKADLFRIHQVRWGDRLRKALPTRYEAIVLGMVLVLGSLLPVQMTLQQQRMWAQAVYRNVTQQIPEQQPSLLLVQIDQESLRNPDIDDPLAYTFNRAYLAQLVNQAALFPNRVIGVDYLLDFYQRDNDPLFEQALRNAVKQGKRIVLATAWDNDEQRWNEPLPEFVEAGKAWQGNVELWSDAQQLTLLSPNPATPLPFSYLLALAYREQTTSEGLSLLNAPEPSRDSSVEEKFYPSLITRFSYLLRQGWMHPIVDFSIPPAQIYQRVTAQEFLSWQPDTPVVDPSLVIVIAPGGYTGAGITPDEDNIPASPALRYWRERQTPPDLRSIMPGNEGLAYLFNHYQTQRLIVPIPDVWMILAAALIGKGMVLLVVPRRSKAHAERSRFLLFIGGTVLGGTILYMLLCLQLYVSVGLQFPIGLPIAMVWLYTAPVLLKSKRIVGE